MLSSDGINDAISAEDGDYLAVTAGPSNPDGTCDGCTLYRISGDTVEPVADAARGILDGHVVLSRRLAQRGHYPAVDVLDSVSRVAGHVMDQSHAAARQQVLRLLAKHREIEELVQIGAYATGADPEADTAIDLIDPINELLRQRPDEPGRFDKALEMMVKLALQSGEMVQQRRAMRAAGQQPAPQRARAR